MIEFSDILVGTPIPLHAYLSNETRLSVGVIIGGEFLASTPFVRCGSGDGIWELPGSLRITRYDQWFNLIIEVDKDGYKQRFNLAPTNVQDLIVRVRSHPNESHEFRTCEKICSSSFLMTCSIKIYPPPVDSLSPQVVGSTASKQSANSKTEDDPLEFEDDIPRCQNLFKITPDDDPNKPSCLNELGAGLRRRFVGDLKDLESTILSYQKAVQITPDGHTHKPRHLNNLGIALFRRFERLGNLKDLENAISSYQIALNLIPKYHPMRPGLLSNLGCGLEARFDRLRCLEDLENAISNYQTVIEFVSDDHKSKSLYIENLGTAIYTRFECLGNLEDLERAITSYQNAVELMPDDDHPHKRGCLTMLGNSLLTRFEQLGNLGDLDSAILVYQKAIPLTSDDDTDESGPSHNLGIGLSRRFERSGNLNDLESAISIFQISVDSIPDSHPAKPAALSNLGNSLYERFEHLRSFGDLEDAISNYQKAVELMPDGDRAKPLYIANLGNGLIGRFQRLGNIDDLESAIAIFQIAVDLTPDSHPEKHAALFNLGNGLYQRFECLQSIGNLEDAISNYQKAVELTPDDHLAKPNYLDCLGNGLTGYFQRLGVLEDLERAISSYQNAVDLVPDGHPRRPDFLFHLGNTLFLRFKCRNDQQDLVNALSTVELAANSPTGSPGLRFKATKQWVRYAEMLSVSPIPAYQCYINLLPRIAWLGIPVPDQHALLADLGAILPHAIKAAIVYEQYETAVEWAEQGRSIMWQKFLGLRTPLDNLRVDNRRLASRLQDLSRKLEALSVSTTSNQSRPMSNEDATRTYSQLAIEWDKAVEEVRLISGFETFLRAKRFDEIAPVASEGPVVILNDHPPHGDALILIPDDSAAHRISVINIPLEDFTPDMGGRLLLDLKSVLSKAGVRSGDVRKSERMASDPTDQAKFSDILRELWLKVVKPVIDGLGYQDKKETPSRIWWCATGSLAFLPIHAAGLYGAEEAEEKVSDYVISSYTPTLTALLDQSDPIIPEDFRILAVAERSILRPITKTEDEVRLIKRLSGDLLVTDLINEKATVDVVLQSMKESHWIHLACHGHQDMDDPMKSGFLLHGGNTLMLSEIVRQTLPNADFAFLSARQTAMGDEKMADESVHLAAGMLLSGCKGVIVTMWSVGDDDAPKIAEEVYRRILKDGRPNRKGAALALHEATKRLRQEAGADFVSWVPFIHIGR